jgi:hypothetical protein
MLRNLSVSVEVYVKATATVIDIMDNISEEIEIALAADETLSGLAESIELTGTSAEITADGEQPIGVLKLDYNVVYRTTISDPTTSL